MCITLVLGCWQGSFVVGCVRSTTCSEVPATWVLRRCGVGGPAILRVSIWRRFRAETLHPLQSFDISPVTGNWNIFLYWKMFFFSFQRDIILFFLPLKGALSMKYATPSLLFIIFHYFTIHFSIIPLTHCPLVTGTSYYLLNNTKIR